MLTRSLAIMVLLLLGMPPAGWAAEPAGATIVLQLPSSMSPDAVRGLIADLAGKGARPIAQPSDPPEASVQPAVTTANVAAQVWDGSKQAVHALPIFRQAPQIWIEQVEAYGGTPGVALRFWMVALAGLVAAPLIDWKGFSRGSRSPPDPCHRTRARPAFAGCGYPIPRSGNLFGFFRRLLLDRAALRFIGPLDPRRDRRPAGRGRADMAALDHHLDDRRLAAFVRTSDCA